MAGLKCPLCGRPLEGFKERQYETYHFGALSPMPAGSRWERQEPVRAPTVENDVIAPGLQAIVTGVIIGFAGGALAVIRNWYQPIAIGVLTAGISGGITWGILLVDGRSLLRKIEIITGADLDEDGIIGEPDEEEEPEPASIRIELEERRRRGFSLRYVDLPCTQKQLEKLVNGILNGMSWAEVNWIGKGKPFSKRQFGEVRAGLIANGLAQWVNPAAHAQGLELTHAGRAVFKHIAGNSPTPERAHAQAG